MATRGARGDIFIWICSVGGWGHIGEEIFKKKKFIKKVRKKKVIFRRRGADSAGLSTASRGTMGDIFI